MVTTSAPTTEKGAVVQTTTIPDSPFGNSRILDLLERNPLLKWPRSVRETYPAMLNDSQMDALRRSVSQPTKRRTFLVDPNGASDDMVTHVASDLGLPIKGAETEHQRRLGGQFS